MYTSSFNNLILNSDSYKTSHWVQYPAGSEYLSCYIEARSGDYDVVFFGLQALIKNSSGQLQTIKTEDLRADTDNLLRDVYVDGQLLSEDSLTTIRERAGW